MTTKKDNRKMLYSLVFYILIFKLIFLTPHLVTSWWKSGKCERAKHMPTAKITSSNKVRLPHEKYN